jgi:DNA-binding response OmpR family regulator
VLIVDSEARTLAQLAAALHQCGYDTLEALTFIEAKQLLLNQAPDVLVAAVQLGPFNGLQLLMRGREERPDLTAVITCRFPDPVLEIETRRLGGTFLVKPLDIKQVIQTIEQELAQPKQVLQFQEDRAEVFISDDRWSDMVGPPPSNYDRRSRDRRQQTTFIDFPDRRLAGDRRRPDMLTG